jgi:pimeloyl-ACP methyl ester carboxylesterase
MSSTLRFGLILSLLLACLPFSTATGQETSDCITGSQQSGAEYLICTPASLPWNGDLVIFAHGYVSVTEPVGIPKDQLILPDGAYLPDLVTGLGYAFATTSYSMNGLAILAGVDDVVDLVSVFSNQIGTPARVYLGGASEGGLVTALAVEQFPHIFMGGLSTCGPVGDFRMQINHFGDFRVLFDYFFPGLLPPTAVDVPQEVMDNWESVYLPKVAAALAANPGATAELLRVARAPVNPFDPKTAHQTLLGLLWYNVFSTNDGIAKLGGQPFDNSLRWYYGSSNDLRLNRDVERYSAEAAALAEINDHYQTTGKLSSPLVTMHTTGDPIVPYWHAPLYTLKTIQAGSTFKHLHIPIFRYGHCNFKPSEVLAGFGLLVWKTSGFHLRNIEAVLTDVQAQAEYQILIEEYGSDPASPAHSFIFVPLVSHNAVRSPEQ